jgi:hypothetical protein
VSLMTKSQATRAKAAGGAAMARRQGRRAATQVTPLAVAAAASTRRGVHSARTWTAPRLERAGHNLEQRVAPKMATMLSAVARRVDPAPPKRRRWPILAAGFVAAAGLSATAAYLISRRNSGSLLGDNPEEPAVSTVTARETAETASSDVNGRVHTP